MSVHSKTSKPHGGPIFLLDSNVLIALATPDHTAHRKAREWFGEGRRFATCPITQGALIRFHMRLAGSPSVVRAKELLARICASPLHEFWADDESYLNLPERGIVGHRQITDAYLAALAVRHEGILATLDEALAAIAPGSCLLISE